jgi:putative tryptophan/tyrosine transport system substrate-binding protein
MGRTRTSTRRRRFLRSGLALVGSSLLAGCAPPAPTRYIRIGVLSGNAIDPSPEGTALRAALRDLGYIDGRNLSLTFRTARLPETLARESTGLVRQGVDAIVTVDDEATRAARDASQTIPVVMADSSDPVRSGLIASLRRPGGNVTGVTSLTATLASKRLELLRAATPGISRVALLWVAPTGGPPDLRDVQAAAHGMGVQIIPVVARSTTNVASPLRELSHPVDAVIVFTLPSIRTDAVRVAAMLGATGLPTIYDAGSFAHAGGLMAYGASSPHLFRRAAVYVDKIVKGARPADLPVELPTTFDCVVNFKTARDLGLTIPPSVLLQLTDSVQ